MAEVFFDNPPALSGKEAQQLQQIYAYLGIMSDKLNQALMSISIDQMAPQVQQTIRTAEKEQKQSSTEALKSMIVKTAEIVRNEMTEISAALESRYQAISSQFGAYEQNLNATITATAEGILQQYQFQERISDLEEETEDFTRRINQYIFTGLVDEANGRYGIAIGEDITAYDQQGNPVINNNRKTATFTMDRLSFWRGNIELAYFSDNIFHIAQGEVTKSMKMGNHTWEILPDGSMGLVAGQTGGNA